MSKFRNRSIRTLPKHVIKDCKTARGEHSHEHYFGENVDDDSSEYVSTISSSKDNQDFKDLSSSSQMSFNDFYEDRTAKVNEELRRLDRILKGLEPVPSYYSQDEFDQWMTTFPGLCIFDDTEEFNQTAKSKQEDTKKIQSPKSGKKLPICDSTNTSPIKRLGEDAVIKSRNDFRIKEYGSKRNDFRLSITKNVFTVSHTPDRLSVNQFLKVSPIKGRQERRSNKSLPFLKDYTNDDTNKFLSLPFLFEESRNISSSLSRMKPKQEDKKKKQDLILPPINNSQFRSISATPSKPISNYSERGRDTDLKKMSKYLINNPFGTKSHLLL